MQTGFTFLVLAYPGCPGKGLLNGCSSSSNVEGSHMFTHLHSLSSAVFLSHRINPDLSILYVIQFHSAWSVFAFPLHVFPFNITSEFIPLLTLQYDQHSL